MVASPGPEVTTETGLKLNCPVLRFAMRTRGWSQAELARRAGVHESTMSRALNGGSTTLDVVRAIMAAFGDRLLIQEVLTLGTLSPGLLPGALDIPDVDDPDVIT